MIEFALTAITRSLALRAICLFLALQAPIFLRIQASLMQIMGEPALGSAVRFLLEVEIEAPHLDRGADREDGERQKGSGWERAISGGVVNAQR